MSCVMRCDWCGEQAHDDAPLIELRATPIVNADNSATTAGWVGHYHSGRWRDETGQPRYRNCFERMREKLQLIHEYAPAALENTPVATPQKVAQLRRKHRTEDAA